MLRLHWWSPLHHLRTAASELRHSTSAWTHIGWQSRRLLRNFGDELSPWIVEAVLGEPIMWAPLHSADMVAIGSILDPVLLLDNEITIWGSGLKAVTLRKRSARMKILAVRGKLTKEALGLPEVTLGDPGILAGPISGRGKQQRSGVVLFPHFSDYGTNTGRNAIKAMRQLGTSIVPPTAKIDDVLDACKGADLVLSSALHGLVLADSTQTRAIPVRLSIVAREPIFKYQDYLSVYGMDYEPAYVGLDVLDKRFWEQAEARAAIIENCIENIQNELISTIERNRP